MPKCKICKETYERKQDGQVVCSYQCAIKYGNNLLSKKVKETKKEARRELKQFNNNDVPVLKRKAQKVFNEYIRLRDKDLPCISCGHNFKKGRQRHAGHYKAQGGHSALRYDERNCHAQCSICNNHKSGNLTAYREALILKIGLEEVETLESNIKTKKWTKEELEEVISTYKKKIKELK